MAPLEGMLKKIQEMERAFDTMLSTKANNNQMVDLLDKVASKLAEHSTFVNKSVEVVKNAVVSAHQRLDEIEKNNIPQTLTGIINEIASLKSSLGAAVTSSAVAIERTKAQLEGKIEAAKQEVATSPSVVDALKDEMSKKHELVAMDAQNAMIRSQNADQRIMLLEKKLENVYLLLKKVELLKQ